MKNVFTLITLLTVVSIGTFSHAASKSTNASEQTTQDEHVTTAPIPAPVPVPVISTEEDKDVFAIHTDDGC